MPYLSIINDPTNTDSPAIWKNFSPVGDVYVEYTVRFINLDSSGPGVNSSPGQVGMMASAVSVRDDLYFGPTAFFTGYESGGVGVWEWGPQNGDYLSDGSISEATEYLVQFHAVSTGLIASGPGAGQQGWDVELRVNGVSFGTASGWSTGGTNTVQSFYLFGNGAHGGTEVLYGSVKIGTGTWGADEIFSVDYDTEGSIPGPWTGIHSGDGVFTLSDGPDPPPPEPPPLLSSFSSPFRIQITPLLRSVPGSIDPEDILEATQFWNVEVDHVINLYKTGKVELSMYDPVVEGLQPREFALRVLFEDRDEPVFWGPCNIKDNYETGRCILEAQDPSWRMQHHYLRRGDDAITHIPEQDKGVIDADVTGIAMCVEAAQNLPVQDARNDPILGCEVLTYDYPIRSAPVIVERGQECWQVITDLSKTNGGPDIDMETNLDLDGRYAYLTLHTDLGVDRTSATPDTPTADQVVLTYGPELTGVMIDPDRGTSHAHVLSSDTKHRRTAGAIGPSNDYGPTVDWIPTDLQFPDGDDDVLQELANAHVAAYGYAPKFIQITSRPDAVLPYSYGNPAFVAPVGTKESSFYIGDRVTVRATRGYRSHIGPARITRVKLTQSGSRGPAQTHLTLVPTIGDLGEDEES